MAAMDDTEQWRRACEGDGEAFGRLFDRHRDRVYRHAVRLLADPHDAEDVLAAAFLELWRCRRRVRIVDSSLLPWLLVTATNLSRNRRRGLRRHEAFLLRLPRTERTSAAEDTVLATTGVGIDPDLLAAIAGLGDLDRNLLVLVALEDFPLTAAAEALGLTPQAARSRWQRLRRRLAEDQALPALTGEH